MPTALIVVLSALAFLLLLLLFRVRLVFTCREEVRVTAWVLCFPIVLYPRQKKPKLPKEKEEKKEKKRRKSKKKRKEDSRKPKKSLPEKIRLVRALLAALLRRTRRYLHLRAVRAHISVATGDAASTAVLYGAVSAALSGLLALLDRAFNLKAPPGDVAVFPDFTGEKTKADLKIVLSLSVFGALAILFSVAIAYVKVKLGSGKKTGKSPAALPQERKEANG
ncbi:MAG: DUF2953 domain-containing protein [Eubacteriales bacterium]|nr:DUF2953 domain-containing protein [Eubacteriales bacterium]MDY2826666.1 DUF2953 domain-containing protein [Eubacteriales bacterium]